MPRNGQPTERRLERGDWVELALETLAQESVEAVLIVPLAKKLGVTKGSFYWHFKSREELLRAALDLWRTRATKRVIEFVEAKSDDPETRLRQLFKIAVESKYKMPGGQIEIAVRDWARQDPIARKVVARVDNERLAYVAALYRALGFDDMDAKTRALLQMSFSTGNGIVFGMSNKRERAEHVARCLELLLTPSVKASKKR